MKSRSVWLRLGALGLLTGLLSLLTVQRASAHALLVRSLPAANDRLSKPPITVDLWFSEPLDRSFSRVEVRDQAGQRVDAGRVEFNPADATQMSIALRPLNPGIYIVSWRTLSTVDGHQWLGSFSFIVLNPDGSVPEGSATLTAQSEAPPPPVAAVRWLELVSAALLFGSLAFLLLVAQPATRVLSSSHAGQAADRLRRQAILWGTLAALAFMLMSSLEFIQEAQALGGLSTLPDYLFRSRPGHLRLLRLGLVMASLVLLTLAWTGQRPWPGRLLIVGMLAVLTLFLLTTSSYGWVILALILAELGLTVYSLYRDRPPETLLTGPAPLWSALILAAGALLTMSLMSHAGAVSPGAFWATLADSVHLLGASFWIGGLAGLLLLMRIGAGLDGFARTRFLARAAGRFSPLAALSVALIVGSGVFSGLVHVPSLSALLGTVYGRALLVKLVLVVLMLSVGGVNAFLVRPRLERAAGVVPERRPTTAPSTAEIWRRRLLVTVFLEASLGILVLASVGVLSKVPPSRAMLTASATQLQAEEQGAFEQTVTAADLPVTLTVTPNRAGINRFVVRVDGIDPGEIQRVRLTFVTTDPRFGGSAGVAEPSGEGEWVLEGPYLTFGGPWQVLVDLRRVAKDDVTAQYRLLAAGPLPPKAGPSPSAFGAPEVGLDLNILVGVYILAAGLGILLWRRSAILARNWLSYPSLAVSTLAILVGLMLIFGVHTHVRPAAGSGNRPQPSPQSIARGAELFAQNCAQCHGVTGKGDGPLAPSLNPWPVDLTKHVPFHPDEQLYSWITNGLPGTAMPAFKELLTEEERWHILNYLRNLATPQAE